MIVIMAQAQDQHMFMFLTMVTGVSSRYLLIIKAFNMHTDYGIVFNSESSR